MSGCSSKLTMSEPRLRTALNRTREASESANRASATGRHCNGGGTRPNNWQEIPDWSIAGNAVDARQVANNADQDRKQRPAVNVGRAAREQESPKPVTRVPGTFPRTDVLKTQRGYLDNIRQRLMLSDADDISTDDETNNDYNIRAADESRQRNNSDSGASGQAVGGTGNRSEQMTVDKDGPDSNQIIGRLMQIRDYIKQTVAMMQQMKNAPNLCSQDSYAKLNSLLESLREQEKGYLNLLQKVLEAKEEDILIRQNSSDSRHVLDSDVSTQIEMQSDLSTGSQSDLVAMNDELQSLRQQHELLKEMLSQQEQLRALRGRQAALTALKKEAEESLNEQRSRTAAVLAGGGPLHPNSICDDPASEDASSDVEDVPLMTVVAEPHRNSVRMMSGEARHSSGTASKLQRLENLLPADDGLSEGQQSRQTEPKQQSNAYERLQLQKRLLCLQKEKQEMDELLQELHMLRDEQLHTQSRTNNDVAVEACQSSEGAGVLGRTEPVTDVLTGNDEDVQQMMELRKLKKLEVVKERLDQLKQLVRYYKTSTEFIHGNMGDDSDQGSRADRALDQADASSEPPCGDYENANFIANIQQVKSTRRRLPVPSTDVDPGQTSQDGKASNGWTPGGIESEESSDFDGWGNDPGIQEKVQRLKAAKEKLHHLQALVSIAQNNPEALQYTPKDLAELAASFGEPQHDNESGDIEEPERVDEMALNTISTPSNVTGALSVSPNRGENFYQSRMAEQKSELEQLLVEKRKLLALQENLQRLHDELPALSQNNIGTGAAKQETGGVRQQQQQNAQVQTEGELVDTEVKSMTETTQVTFGEPLETVISNEELYGQMRQQRILREELREKKKELENFMKKDKPKRHYFRNQDNQSDNVSYSNKSDLYGASASEDVTMATWGGSTAGNMESIEENESGEGQDIGECQDGYPHDGIVQVEEEEEEANGQSDDHVTYIIDEDFSARRVPRPPIIESSAVQGEVRKSGKGAPFIGSRGAGGAVYSQWASSSQKQVLNNVGRSAFEQTKVEQARKNCTQRDSAIENEVCALKEQVQYLTSVIQNRPDLGSPHLFVPHLAPGLKRPVMYPPYASPYPIQLTDRQLLTAVEEMRERIDILERNNAYLGQWQQRTWQHECDPGTRPVYHLDMPLGQNYSSDHNIPLAPMPHSRSFQASQPFVDPYTPSVPSSSYAYRNWASARHQEPVRAKKPENKGVGHDEGKPSIISDRVGSSGNYTAGRQEMLPGHSADNIPIDTVHAANKQAFREPCPVRSDKLCPVGMRDEGCTGHENQFSCDRAQDDIVIACQFSTPMRLSTGARLAEQQLPDRSLNDPECQQSGEPARFGQSISSITGSDGDTEQMKSMKPPEDIDSDVSNDVHAFEALRETIYAEVATLISQNETRPHFLIKLFRELQHLDSDYLRQRALYAIQDLVLKHLTENGTMGSGVLHTGNENTVAPAPEDLTPSESLLSTEDGNKDDDGSQLNGDRFDYAENVDTSSSLSTPTSTDTHSDQPFVGDSLGDTVIHMEKHPGIDTHQLDVQIKEIMKEIMPVLKDHMDETCSQHLLQYIKRLVLLLMKQYDNEHEMARFFHTQLGSMLQESMAKFEGRKLCDCGEDLLVDMSEILFNELAFFRLMQGLDTPKTNVKASLQRWQEEGATSLDQNRTSEKEDEGTEEPKSLNTEKSQDVHHASDRAEEDKETNSSSGELEENGEANEVCQMTSGSGDMTEFRVLFNSKPDNGEAGFCSAMKIELAPSETKPYTRIGSDEDDEGEDKAADNEEPSDTAVSRDAQNDMMDNGATDGTMNATQDEAEEATNDENQPETDEQKDVGTTEETAPRDLAAEPEKYDGGNEKDLPGRVENAVDDKELTIEDLPARLSGLSEEDLSSRMASEQSVNNVTDAIVSELPHGDESLAGDPEVLNTPTN